MAVLCRCLLLLLCVLIEGPPRYQAEGQAPRVPKKQELPQVDLYGDPLPACAIRRIGSIRLRHGAEICCLTSCPGALVLASGSFDYSVSIWDGREGKEVHRLLGHE